MSRMTLVRRMHSPVGYTMGTKQKSAKDLDFNMEDLAQVFQNDPNIEAFYDEETVRKVNEYIKRTKGGDVLDRAEIKSLLEDEYNLSLIEGMDRFENKSYPNSFAMMNSDAGKQSVKIPAFQNKMMTQKGFSAPVHNEFSGTMKTEDFLKMLNEEGEIDPDNYIPGQPVHNNANNSCDTRDNSKPVEPSALQNFLRAFRTPKSIQPPLMTPLASPLISSQLPLIIISQIRSPHLNLAIEKYVYEKYPSAPTDAKRLMVYTNSPCLVIGKNQNIYKECNFHLSQTLNAPILRRFSGGGTVVHDLGNTNFSFIAPKQDFSRVSFTEKLIDTWNAKPFTLIKLNINEKGDMIDAQSGDKVSGSAYQISRGRSLHHGTMLLQADLKELGQLLKVNPHRKDNIIDKSTKSIPSKVRNTGVTADQFADVVCEAFVGGYGTYGDIEETELDEVELGDNVFLYETGDLQCKVLTIDNSMELPQEVLDTAEQLKSWEWTFGHTPKFEQTMKLKDRELKFVVNKGQIVELAVDGPVEGLERLLEKLGTESVRYSSDTLSQYVDGSLGAQICWLADDNRGL